MSSALARRSASIGICYLFRNNSPFFCKSHYVSSFSQQLLYFSSSNPKVISLEKPISSNFFIDKYHFSPEIASKVAHSRSPQNSDIILSFLKEKGFSSNQLERRVKPKFKILREFGVSDCDVAEVVGGDLSIMRHGENWIIHSLSVLKRLLGSNDHVIKLLKKPNRLFFADLEKTLLPNIELLKSSGIPMEQVISFIYTVPNFFLVNPEYMRKYVHKVDEMGVERTSKMFLHAVRAVSSMSDSTWELKLRTFRELGFSEDDILRVFQSTPTVFSAAVQKLKKVTEFLLETGKYDMSCIVSCPESFTRSVEKRFKPRVHVLKVLQKRSLINKWPTLATLCVETDNIFFKKFVAPYIKKFGEDIIVKNAFGAKGEMKALL